MSLYWLRRLCHGSDTPRAASLEARVFAEALNSAQTPYPWDQESASICLGTLMDGKPLMMPASAQNQNAFSIGTTGGGKTANDARLAVETCDAEGAGAMAWGNSKPDLIQYFRAGLAHKLLRMKSSEAAAILKRVVVLAPGSAHHLVPLQLLALPPGADPELLAFDVASSFANLSESAIGVRQEEDVDDVFALCIEFNLPITVAKRLLRSPELIVRLARRSRNPERFLAFALRVRRAANSDRQGGLIARFSRITRLRFMRLMLGGARSCIDFAVLMACLMIILVDLSAPDHGCEEALRFVGHFLWKRFVRAGLSRPIGSPHFPVFIDEFQELLAAGPDVGPDLERCLRLVRARGISLHLATQSLAGLQKYSSSLPEILRVNTGLHFVYRGGDLWDSALPVTGKKRRNRLPWEAEPRGNIFLSRAEEIATLRAQLETLPNRHCYVHDARTGRPAICMRTADANLAMPDDCPAHIIEGLERGMLVLPVSELEAGLEAVERRLAELADDTRVSAADDDGPVVLPELTAPRPAEPARRRGSRPLEMG
jgi:hypothetical protein